MSKFGKDLVQSMREAREHAEAGRPDILLRRRGAKTAKLRIHVMAVPNVRAIRRKLRISQTEFAKKYRIPLPTLKNWEQGRRLPDAPASAYLQAIARRPKEISDALAD